MTLKTRAGGSGCEGLLSWPGEGGALHARGTAFNYENFCTTLHHKVHRSSWFS